MTFRPFKALAAPDQAPLQALALAPVQAAVLAEGPEIVPAVAAAMDREAAKVQVLAAAPAPARAVGIWRTPSARAPNPASPAAGATPPPEFAAAVRRVAVPVPWPSKPA